MKKNIKKLRKKIADYKRLISFEAFFKSLEFIAILLQILEALFGDNFVRHIIEILSKLLGIK